MTMGGGGSDGDQTIVVVKKRKKNHGGHHGGSWKVAYADFVTAMMAFFLVMWIMGLDEGVKDVVAGYFANPVGFERGFSGGRDPLSSGTTPLSDEGHPTMIFTREAQTADFERVADRLEGRLEGAGVGGHLSAEVEIVITEEGLRIELMETDQGALFFERSSSSLKPALDEMLTIVAEELQTLPNPVVVEGHTDAARFVRRQYTNWELSVDRANAARSALTEGGLPPHRIAEVRGYAHRELRNPDQPYAARNRRISILLPFLEAREIVPGTFGLPTEESEQGS